MTDTVVSAPSLGGVRVFLFVNGGRFFSTRESTLGLTGWTSSCIKCIRWEIHSVKD